MSKVRSVHRFSWLVAAVLAASTTGRGERLPTRIYRTGDGLVSNRVSQIVRDSLGYLWFCTEQGLSRFDGNTFTNYTTDQGLPDNEVNDLLETRSGAYWVATAGGLCLFNPMGSASERPSPGGADSMFVVYRPGKEPRESIVKTLYEDRSGSIWIGTWHGLYRLEPAAGRVLIEPVDLGPPASHSANCVVRNILEDHRGILWIATDTGLYRRQTDGRVDRFDSKNGAAGERFMGLLEDSKGRLWVGNRSNGLNEIVEQPDPSGSIVTRKCPIKDAPGCMTTITSLFQSSDGSLWIGADCGLSELIPQETEIGQAVKARLGPKDLADPRVWSLAGDSFGNLWVGSADGAIRISRGGPTTFTSADGLGALDVRSIFESRSGRLCVYTRAPDRGFINSFGDEEHFTAIRPRLPAIAEFPTRITMQDSKRNWWMSGDEGVWRYPAADDPAELGRLRPEPFSTPRPDHPGAPGASVYEDRLGDIWISNAVTRNLTRWQRSTARMHVYSEADGLPPLDRAADKSYSEDRDGALWIAFGEAEVARYKNGRFQVFKASDGLPAGAIDQLYIDSKGRLWIASSAGLGRVEDPTEEPLRVSMYTTADGLSSNKIGCVTEDRWGRLFAGTANGLDRLDVATGRIKRFTTADGLANNDVRFAFRDRKGALWFGTETGLSRLAPETDPPQPPPAIFISGIRISGNRFKLSELGEIAVGAVEFGPSQNDIQIEFTGLSFGPGEALRFQYKLEGADRDWNPPARQPTVNYASLSPGAYRFLVRAVNADGILSAQPAVFDFTILRPLWQRWWFVALVAGLAGSLIYGLYRYRLAQLLEIERVRTRLAADLHDDIGSNLSQIAVWSEVARRQPSGDRADQPPGEPADVSPEPLERIAATARETASAMSDIVWAINPRRDYLSDLISRMRLFAGEAFDSRDIAWQLDAPQTNLGFNARTRREVFLIFKECVNNIIRHANCTRVEAAITIEGNRLRLRIRDDGSGFDTRRPNDGHGLDSLRQRARNLAGALDLVSAPGEGTTVEFEMPLSQSRWRR